MSHDPNGLVTRRHWITHKPGCAGAPPPLHVLPLNEEAAHFVAPRPMAQPGATPGPALIIGGTGLPSLGIDPTDPTSWGTRGYRQSTGMIGRFNTQSDFGVIPGPGGQGVRPA